jgi:hypothetical protein
MSNAETARVAAYGDGGGLRGTRGCARPPGGARARTQAGPAVVFRGGARKGAGSGRPKTVASRDGPGVASTGPCGCHAGPRLRAARASCLGLLARRQSRCTWPRPARPTSAGPPDRRSPVEQARRCSSGAPPGELGRTQSARRRQMCLREALPEGHTIPRERRNASLPKFELLALSEQ